MDEFDRRAFADLFNAVVVRCFGQPLSSPLSEPECKHLSTEIEEDTGLVIGWKSVKNYAAFVLNSASGKPENPSVATLDTLARYVFRVPVTSEVERKKMEDHFPYWFRYREQVGLPLAQPTPVRPKKVRKGRLALILASLVGVAALVGFLLFRQSNAEPVQEDFNATDETYLRQKGWFLQDVNADFWDRRAQNPHHLTLFTLKGDSWPKSGETP